jgi:phytol kinase
MSNVVGIAISFAFIIVIVLSAKLFEKAGKEASRKFIHIMLSNWWIIAIVFFDNMWSAALVPAIFVIVNYISYKTNLIDVMEREEGEENKDSLGTVYYAISLLILALITFGPMKNPLIGLCGILVMGYGDGLAAVIGKAVQSKEFNIFGNKKTLAGSITMFIVTCIILSGFLYYSKSNYWAIKSVVIAGIMTVIEAISIKGTDNITVPLLTSLLAFLMI